MIQLQQKQELIDSQAILLQKNEKKSKKQDELIKHLENEIEQNNENENSKYEKLKIKYKRKKEIISEQNTTQSEFQTKEEQYKKEIKKLNVRLSLLSYKESSSSEESDQSANSTESEDREQQDQAIGKHVSSGKYNGSTLFKGPMGGVYYLSKNNKKYYYSKQEKAKLSL